LAHVWVVAVWLVAMAVGSSSPLLADDGSAHRTLKYEPPQLIEAAGQPISVEAPGNACPTVVDLDGDGRLDLVVGQFSGGMMQYFRNEAEVGAVPKFAAAQWLMKEGSRATMPGGWGFTGSTPQFVDWDNDGRLDILSGCYWTEGADGAHIQILLGQGGLNFAPAQALLNAEGKPLLNRDLPGGRNDPNIIDNICTQQHAVDYDGDGVLDLVVGSFGPHFYLYKNGGDAAKPLLSAQPVKLPIRSPDYQSAPHLVDINGDGKLEFISGSLSGKVYISYNEGSRAEPKWTKFQVLLDIAAESEVFTMEENFEPKPGSATRVWTTDWNGDGRLDLVVGDTLTISSPAAGLSEEQFKAKRTEWEEAVAEADTKASEKMMELYQSRAEWINERRTGHVWVYLQQATPFAAPADDR
jgi:hypothetical protein